MKKKFLFLLLMACGHNNPFSKLERSPNDLHFTQLSSVWDEAIPLGNGMIGALIWEHKGKLRFSLDRADLWDLCPMENLNTPEWRFD